MAEEGQIKKDVIKKARKNPAKPAKPAETTKVEESDDPYSQASIDAGSLEGKVSPAPAMREDQPSQASTETPTSSEQPSMAFLDMYRGVRDQMAKEKETEAQQAVTDPAKLESAAQDLASFRSGLGVFTEEGTPQPRKDTMLEEAYRRVGEREKRREIAADLKSLSKRGALTGDLLKEARQKAEKAGVTGEQFESFMEKNRIRERGSPFSFKRQKSGTGLFDQPAPSPEAAARATQKVLYEREFGTEPLSMQKAMQSEDYVTGSYSQNLFKSRPLSGRKSSAYEREARRAERKGEKSLASGLRAKAAEARVGGPSIDTPALKQGRRDAEIAAGEEAILQDKVFSETMRRAAESDARLRDMQQPRRLR